MCQLTRGTAPNTRKRLRINTRSQNSHTTPNSHTMTGAAAFGVTKATAATTGSVRRQKKRQM